MATWTALGDRIYAVRPDVSDGDKTIRASAIDASGATATATANLAITYQDQDDATRTAEPGSTIVYFGWRISVPAGVMARRGGVTIFDAAEEDLFSIFFDGPGYRARLRFGQLTGKVYEQYVFPFSRSGTTETPDYDEAEIYAILEFMADSIRPVDRE